ncbi:MAG TPA: hypothetical protein PKY13_00240 [Microthrixaceae bacterium]|nr:hypothetical protein [Microthrixaceae bacterium]HQF93563.1 hypothetical protein [Microthrixaceae bacterium]
MSDTTRITELVTGLGMLGGDHPLTMLPVAPGELRNVDAATWDGLVESWHDPALRPLVDAAFENGRFFFEASDALRRRRPRTVEWTGPQRSPGDEVAPVDLRVDHVYLVSCKYLSKITMNASPAHVFERLLTGGHGRRSNVDWYRHVAAAEFDRLWSASAAWLTEHHDGVAVPDDPATLSKPDRKVVSELLRDGGKSWPQELLDPYRELCAAVSVRSALAWQESISTAPSGAAEAMLWRLLRIGSAPYFVLGVGGAATAPLRLRVASPWDWRQHFTFRRLEITPMSGGQPMVGWRAEFTERDGAAREVHGHVEIRWSHGRFSGPPEAKVYLDTPFGDVPGYWSIA